jgi:HSP20 family protein
MLKISKRLSSHAHGLHSRFPSTILWDTPFSNQPSIDIIEESQKYKVKVYVPGIPKENLHAFVDSMGNLIIKGEYKQEKENFLMKEMQYGQFSRSFFLPNIDSLKINSKLSDGILSLDIPKKTPDQKSLKIEIE